MAGNVVIICENGEAINTNDYLTDILIFAIKQYKSIQTDEEEILDNCKELVAINSKSEKYFTIGFFTDNAEVVNALVNLLETTDYSQNRAENTIWNVADHNSRL